jgi:predicted ATPase/class 3 adenylate cyclase
MQSSGPNNRGAVAAPPGHDGHPVTLVFTDIQGSTQLWEELGSRFIEDLDLHNELLRDSLRIHRGYEVKTEGDAFMVAFASERDALSFCMHAQEALQEADWSVSVLAQTAAMQSDQIRGLAVRMGIHTGLPQLQVNPLSGRMDYFGPMVNRAARISSAAHGGQVVLSQSSLEPLGTEIEGLQLKDLGIHSLKGLLEPENIHQSLPESLASRRFPRLRTQNRNRSRLPVRADDFIGRESLLQQISRQIVENRCHLLTLVGSGGSGKTRLAEEWARRHQSSFPGGCHFIDLSETRETTEVMQAMATQLDIHISSTHSSDAILRVLTLQGEALFILDNLEQVIEPVRAMMDEWMSTDIPGQWLCTSRTPLRINAEHVIEINPLTEDEAVQLFHNRALRVHTPEVDRTPISAEVKAIVQHLDGLPLAVELAASQMRLMSAAEMHHRMVALDTPDLTPSVSFHGLLGQTIPQTQLQERTIRSTVSRSWELLEPWEQVTLAQCSVFRAGFELADAEAIVDLSEWSEAPPTLVIIQSLLEHSLLRSETSRSGARRLSMLRSISAFSAEKLEERGKTSAIRYRHAKHFAQLGEAQQDIPSPASRVRQLHAQIRGNLDNLRLGTETAVQRGDAITATLCALAAGRVYRNQGPADDGYRLIESAMNCGALPPPLQCRANLMRSYLAWMKGDTDESWMRTIETLEVIQPLNQPYLEAKIRNLKAMLLHARGEQDQALSENQRGLDLCIHPETLPVRATLLMHRASFLKTTLKNDEAEHILRDSIRLMKEVNDAWSLPIAMNHLGCIFRSQGRYQESREILHTAWSLLQEVENYHYESVVLCNLGGTENEAGDLERARHAFEMAMEILEKSDSPWNHTQTLNNVALVCGQQEKWSESQRYLEQALRIMGSHDTIFIEGCLRGNLADALLHLGQFERAQDELSQSLSILRPIHRGATSSFLGIQGLLHTRRGDFTQSSEAFEEAYKLVGGEVPLERAKLHCREARSLEIQGRVDEARSVLRQAEKIAAQLQLLPGSEILRYIRQLRRDLDPIPASSPTVMG